MQYTNEKTEIFAKVLGQLVRNILKEKQITSINKFANEYDIDDSNLNKIQQGKHNAKIVTIWKISEALGIKFSDFAKRLEDELGEDFTLMDK